MHSWWISHFGLWPGSHPITFKLAAACKTLHISQRVPHPLQGPYAPTTTLINQPLVKKKKKDWGTPLLLPQSFTLPLNPPNSSPHANCSSRYKHAVGVTNSTHVFVHLETPQHARMFYMSECLMPHSREEKFISWVLWGNILVLV